jgi:hypothetical protein
MQKRTYKLGAVLEQNGDLFPDMQTRTTAQPTAGRIDHAQNTYMYDDYHTVSVAVPIRSSA